MPLPWGQRLFIPHLIHRPRLMLVKLAKLRTGRGFFRALSLLAVPPKVIYTMNHAS